MEADLAVGRFPLLGHQHLGGDERGGRREDARRDQVLRWDLPEREGKRQGLPESALEHCIRTSVALPTPDKNEC